MAVFWIEVPEFRIVFGGSQTHPREMGRSKIRSSDLTWGVGGGVWLSAPLEGCTGRLWTPSLRSPSPERTFRAT